MASEKQTTNIPDDGIVLWARSSTDSESVEEVLSTSGASHSMSIPDTALDSKTSITPTIKVNSGATSSSGTEVLIDPNNATAGLKHVEDTSPTEAEVLDELVGFEFESSDDVKTVYLGLITYDDGATANGLCPASHLVFTVNGDLVADSTKLFNTYPDVGKILPNEIVRISSTTAITRIGCIAKRRSGAAIGQDTYDGLITCEGYS